MDLPRTPRTRDPRALAKAIASDADELPPVTVEVRPGEEARSRVRKVNAGKGFPVDGTGAPPKPRA